MNGKGTVQVWRGKVAISAAGILGIVMVLLSGERICEPHGGFTGAGMVSDCGPMTSSGPKRPGASWYFRSGQWRADLRSLVAVLQYLREPVGLAQTKWPDC